MALTVFSGSFLGYSQRDRASIGIPYSFGRGVDMPDFGPDVCDGLTAEADCIEIRELRS